MWHDKSSINDSIKKLQHMIRSIIGGLHRYAVNKYSIMRDQHLKNERLKTAKHYLSEKLGHLRPLTSAQRNEIINYWSQYTDVSREMKWFEFYNNWCDEQQLKHIIPDSIMYGDIDVFFTNPRRSYELDDKNLYSMFFQDIKMPPTVVRKCSGVLLDSDYHIIDEERALELCRQEPCVICKQARNSVGGKGVSFVDCSSASTQELKAMLSGPFDLIVQAIISQHESISRLHDKSVNTIRIMSLVLDGQVHLLSGVLRMGRDGSRVDNASSGGIVCGLNDDGTLKEFAYDVCGNCWTQHPQGAVFKGAKIAGYSQCRELVMQLAGRLCPTSRLVSWDFAVGEDGEPILIEVNLTYGQVDFHQMCNGPIFGELTDKILSTVFKKD